MEQTIEQQKVCKSGKIVLADKFEAMLALAQTRTCERRSNNPNRRECRYYRCPDCKGFHLTSTPHIKRKFK